MISIAETSKPEGREILLIGVLGAFNAYELHAISGGVPFAGTSLFSIAPAFAVGSNPAGFAIVPGTNYTFTLTVQSAIAEHIVLSFNSSDTTDWSALNNGIWAGCVPVITNPNTLTMTIGGTSPIAPTNINPSVPGGCGALYTQLSVTLPLAVGVNKYDGMIAVRNTAPSSISFTLNFLGQATA